MFSPHTNRPRVFGNRRSPARTQSFYSLNSKGNKYVFELVLIEQILQGNDPIRQHRELNYYIVGVLIRAKKAHACSLKNFTYECSHFIGE